MRIQLLVLALAAVAFAAPTFTTYTVRGKYYEGCLEGSLCECVAHTYDMSGYFDVASLPAGILIDNIKFAISDSSRYFTGVAVLHQNDTVTPHTQVRRNRIMLRYLICSLGRRRHSARERSDLLA